MPVCLPRAVAPPSIGRWLSTLALLLATGPGAWAQTPGSEAGVLAAGSIRYQFRICSTCDTPSDWLFEGGDGAPGSHGPAVVDGFAARGSGTASVDARALLVGAQALPELHADARATPGVGTHAGFSGDGVYEFSAVAVANGRQYFRYLGAAPQVYTLTYTVSGDARSLLDAPTPFDESLIGVHASLGLFDDGDKLGGELPMGMPIDQHASGFSGAQHQFLTQGSVSGLINPGSSFYVAATLSAQVLMGGYGTADASQTMHVVFSAGDTAQLAPLLSAVPEPGSRALWTLGLGLLAAGVAWRRPPRIDPHELLPTSGRRRARPRFAAVRGPGS